MFTTVCAFFELHRRGERATHPIAHFSDRLALLLLLAWGGHAASSRLASRPEKRTLGRVQLPFLGLMFPPYLLSPSSPFAKQWTFIGSGRLPYSLP